jgi:hypothetical protein
LEDIILVIETSFNFLHVLFGGRNLAFNTGDGGLFGEDSVNFIGSLVDNHGDVGVVISETKV